MENTTQLLRDNYDWKNLFYLHSLSSFQAGNIHATLNECESTLLMDFDYIWQQ